MTNDIWANVAQYLSKREIAQFERALASPLTGFHDRIIAPQFFEADRGFYLSIQTSAYAEGRNHLISERLANNANPDWSAQTYFTNPLRLDPVKTGPDGKLIWTKPMDRVVLGDTQVFTFETDDPTIEFLKLQLSWLRSAGNPLDCPMGDLFRHCLQWTDFMGITVNWSGNKSLHIHLAFTTDFITAEGGARGGHHHHWWRLKELVDLCLQPGREPDHGMCQAERYRRLPNGSRILDKPNLLGMPAGTVVPQVTLWERFLDRAPKGATASFFDPSLFVEIERKATRAATNFALKALNGIELDFCAQKMREAGYDGVNAFPGFDHWSQDDHGNLRAKFINALSDTTPDSYMDLDWKTVSIVGTNPLALTPSTSPRLPRPLGDMVADWLDEYQAIYGKRRTPLEQMFAETVVDAQTARAAIRKTLLTTIRENRVSMVVAPEGAAKTSTLFAQHRRIAGFILTEEKGDGVMYAFADYRAAYEKAEEFNAAQGSASPYRATVIESFDRQYEDACRAMRVSPISLLDASQMGAADLYTAIERVQPRIIEELSRRHAERIAALEGKRPVFFTVHAVAQRWSMSSLTRLMASPDFWIGKRSTEHTALCRFQTQIGLLIHDEIKSTDIVAAYPGELVEWCRGLFETSRVWTDASSQIERFDAYRAYRAITPDPTIDGEPRPVTWEEVQDVMAIDGPEEWDHVLTQDSGEYSADRGIYASRLDRVWFLAERQWPFASHRTVVLTTEAVPLALAQRSQHWAIHDLEAPRMVRDEVETIVRRGLRAANLPLVCAAWRQANPADFIIGNKISAIDGTMTHQSARGSNALMTTDVMQTMVYVSPVEFEYLEALNAWTGRQNLIRLRHVDEFNQTAGRNRGFRNRGARHVLVINESLMERLTGEAKARLRYSLRLTLGDRQKRKVQRAGARTYAPAQVPQEASSKYRLEVMRAALLAGGK